MRFIPTKIHAVLDYVVGLFIAISPWLLGFADGGAETWVPVVLGLGAVAYSLVTDYEGGVYPLLSMPLHLGIDSASGLLLALSPWLFGFADRVFYPHLLLGLFEIGAALFTVPHPRSLPRGNPSPVH